MIHLAINRTLQTILISSILLSSGIVLAERSKGSPGNASSGTTVSEPSDPENPIDKSAECRDILSSYKEFVKDPLSQLEDSVVEALNAVFANIETCAKKVSMIEDILNAYWETEPWCRKDRSKFVELYTSDVSAKLTSEARAIVAALLSQGSLTCSETLYAATTVVRFYDPSFVLYEEVLPADGSPVDSAISARPGLSSKVEFNVDDAAKTKSSKRKLKACQAKVKRLTRR
jgi:hypothetical protein